MKFPLQSSKHLVRSTIDTICSIIEQGIEQGDDHSQSDEVRIHNLRKRSKEIRALLLLIRPVNSTVYKGEFNWFKETAAQLSEQRDRHVFAESLSYLLDHHYISETQHRNAREILCSRGDHIQNSVKLLNNAISRFSQSNDRFVHEKGKSHIVRNGFIKLFFNVQSLYNNLDRSSDHKQFHVWRKQVKYHLFHCQLFLHFDPEFLSPRIEKLKLLGETLGVIQNMAVLNNTLSTEFSSYNISKDISNGCRSVINSVKEDALTIAEQLFSAGCEKELNSIFHYK